MQGGLPLVGGLPFLFCTGSETMFERFTDRARKVMALANQEAQRLNHAYVGTEHILLGLVKEGSGVGANVLRNFVVELRRVAGGRQVGQGGPELVTMGKLPQTPRAKAVIQYAIEEARSLNHNYVGSEHLLLGLLREQDGVAVQVLTGLGVSLEKAREELVRVLAAQGSRGENAADAGASRDPGRILRSVSIELGRAPADGFRTPD